MATCATCESTLEKYSNWRAREQSVDENSYDMDAGRSGYSNGIPATTVPKVRPNLNKAPELQPPELRNWLLHSHYTRKEFGICKILIQEELERTRGKHEYANYVQGIILRHEGKIQESLECFQMCHSLNPRSVDNIKQVARSLFLLGIHNLALEAYLEAELVSNCPDWDIYHNLGECWLRLGDRTKAKEALRRAVQLSRHERSYVALANIHQLEGDAHGAIEVYKAALEILNLIGISRTQTHHLCVRVLLMPIRSRILRQKNATMCLLLVDSAKLATSLGLLYLKQGQHQHALEKLGSALARDPQCAQALLAAGAMMQNHADYDVALSKYKITAQAWPESPALWNNVGMCFYGKKKFVAALSCLKRAHYLSPLDWDILFNLGLVHMATQQYASAFHFLSAATNLRPAHANTFLLLAITLRYLDDTENATEAFERASCLDPIDASIPLNYALFLEASGNNNAAMHQLGRFQQLAQSVPGLGRELIQTATNLGAVLGVGTKQQNESGTTDSGRKARMAVEVEAQVQVRSQTSDSSPDSEPVRELADDEV